MIPKGNSLSFFLKVCRLSVAVIARGNEFQSLIALCIEKFAAPAADW